MTNRGLLPFLFLAFFILHNLVLGQVSVSGDIKDSQGVPLAGAHVLITPGNHFATSNIQGRFKVSDLNLGEYLLSISYLGVKTYSESLNIEGPDIALNIILEDDPLALQSVVVTGTFEPRSKLSSSTAITTLESRALRQSFPRGAAD